MGSSESYPSQLDRDRAGLPHFAERIASSPDPQSADEREKRELAAQESMSVWAFWMLIASTFGVLFTIFGTLALVWQLQFTHKALKAASEANAIALDSSRGWIKIEDIKLTAVSTKVGPNLSYVVMLSVLIKNVGDAPALEVRVMSCAWTSKFFSSIGKIPQLLEEAHNLLLKRDYYSAQHSRALFPDDSYTQSTQSDPVESRKISHHIEITTESSGNFFIGGCVIVHYKTGSGKQRYTIAPFLITSPEFADAQKAYEISQTVHRFADVEIKVPNFGVRAE